MKTWNQFLTEIGAVPGQPGQAPGQQPQQNKPGQPQGEFQLKDPMGKHLGNRRPNGAWTDPTGQPIPLTVAQKYEVMWTNMQRQAQAQAVNPMAPR